MERMAGGLTGMLVFAALIVVGLAHQMPMFDTIWRALVGMVAGTLLGWLVFGPLGHALVQNSIPEPVPAPVPEKPGEAAE